MAVVISLGGSIIVPDKVDYRLLLRFKKLIKRLTAKERVVIVTGGGKTARNYIAALAKVGCSRRAQDAVGIAATRINALLLILFFGLKQAVPITLREVVDLLKKKRIVVCGGFKPGSTSDGTAAEIAASVKAKLFINLTNVAGLYDKDPGKFRDAKLISKISYPDFEKMVKRVKEKPGQHFVLDMLAAIIISKKKIKTVILNGRNLPNLQKCLQGKRFVGTVIG